MPWVEMRNPNEVQLGSLSEGLGNEVLGGLAFLVSDRSLVGCIDSRILAVLERLSDMMVVGGNCADDASKRTLNLILIWIDWSSETQMMNHGWKNDHCVDIDGLKGMRSLSQRSGACENGCFSLCP